MVALGGGVRARSADPRPRREGQPLDPGERARRSPVRLALEIRRDTIATTPAAHGGPGLDSRDRPRRPRRASAIRDDPRLLAYAQAGERKINAEGLSRRGVQASLAAATDAPTGEPGALFSADNTTNGAGWCVTGRKLAKPLDLSRAKALGFWVRGDGHGETLVLMLGDAQRPARPLPRHARLRGVALRELPAPGRPRLVPDRRPAPRDPPHRAARDGSPAGVASIRAVPRAARTRRDPRA